MIADPPPFAAPELLQQVAAFVSGDIQMRSFVNWFMYWGFSRQQRPSGLQAAMEVLMAEYTSIPTDENRFRQAVAAALLDAMPVSFAVSSI